ncbi:MAG: ribbon-helix-helix domain-containing protein [Candidatus Nanoarchaeia archaeon]|nr:ribbon-helix-helix domain-containing protein [Candidatus Nanoarchaeia archaeon]MDD5740968.1 ribbon-helix-helix domain-containing protein [Candidatus Nanoarchaeia archaeon]
MKTITIKLPEEEAHELDIFIKNKNYPSKSEFIRHLIIDKLDKTKKEKIGWMILAEKSLNKLWDNKKDDEVWGKYL